MEFGTWWNIESRGRESWTSKHSIESVIRVRQTAVRIAIQNHNVERNVLSASRKSFFSRRTNGTKSMYGTQFDETNGSKEKARVPSGKETFVTHVTIRRGGEDARVR